MINGRKNILEDSINNISIWNRRCYFLHHNNRNKGVWDMNKKETVDRLLIIQNEIDTSSCNKLKDFFLINEKWTLRAYVAHTILEKNCI